MEISLYQWFSTGAHAAHQETFGNECVGTFLVETTAEGGEVLAVSSE